MPVTDVTSDIDTRTLTITADFAAPIDRVWKVYADPRQMEQIWGPPTYPATVVDHELKPGGRVTYFMTSPEGEKYYGFWNVTAVDEPKSFEFEDGFANEDFTPGRADARLAQSLRVRGVRRRHTRDVRLQLRDRRGPSEGARHGRR